MYYKLLSYAKPIEDGVHHRIRRATAGDFLEKRARLVDVGKQKLLGNRATRAIARTAERGMRIAQQRSMSTIGDRRYIALER